MAAYKEDIIDIDLDDMNDLRCDRQSNIAMGDTAADRFGVRAFRNGEPEDLSGFSCYGYFHNSHGDRIDIENRGTVSGNVAYLTLPQTCYAYKGRFSLAIKLVKTGITETVRIIDGMVLDSFSA